MRLTFKPGLCAAAIGSTLACVAVPAHAATVDVKFPQPQTYSDSGQDTATRDAVMKGLAAHLQQLGSTLPSSQALTVEILNIDLAGEMRPFGRVWPDVRVMRGQADWPAITLRYSLREGSAEISSGQEQVVDMNYLVSSHFRAADDGHALRYERRMLSRWFDERFGRRP